MTIARGEGRPGYTTPPSWSRWGPNIAAAGRAILRESGVAVSVPHLPGREDELAALLDLLESPGELPAAAVLVGEAGIGKTTLWLAGIEAARERGYRVLSCRPVEAEARFSFVGLSDLIGAALADVLPQLPRPQRRALEAALALSEPEGSTVEEGVVAFAFLSALRELAAGNRLLLAIDDVQWLDAPSLAMLRFALARLDGEAGRRDPDRPRRSASVAPECDAGGRLLTHRRSARSVSARCASCCEHAAAPRFPDRRSCASGRRRREIRSSPSSSQGRCSDGAFGWLPGRSCRSPRIWKRSCSSASSFSVRTGWRWPASSPRSPSRRCLSSRRRPAAEQRADWATRSRPEYWRSTGSGSASPIRCSARRSGHAPHRREGDRSTRGSRASLRARRNERGISRSPRPGRAARSPPRSRRRHESAHARGAAATAAELGELAVRLTPAADVDDVRRRVLDCADRLCRGRRRRSRDRPARAGAGRRTSGAGPRGRSCAPSPHLGGGRWPASSGRPLPRGTRRG